MEQIKRLMYGRYRGYYKWDLAKAWFQMTNDDFFNLYGFSFNPHDYGSLYFEVRKFIYGNEA